VRRPTAHGRYHGLPLSRAGPGCVYCGTGNDRRPGSGSGSGRMFAEGLAPGSHRPRLASARRSPLLVPVVASAGHATPSPPGSRDGLCYPPSTMAETRLTKKELADLRIRLEEERVQLDTQLTTIETDSFASTQSDAAGDVGLDDEPADAGTATFEREKDLSIENNVRDLLHKIDRALKRMDDGTYGICDICGKPIEKARVKALPYVDLCIKDAQAQSRR